MKTALKQLKQPNELQTLQDLADRFRQFGDRPAILSLRADGVDEWSYSRIADLVERLAFGMIHAGVLAGDTVALLAANGPEWIVACLATLRVGAVSVPLDPQLGDEALRRELNDSGVRLIFTTSDQLLRISELGTEDPLEAFAFDVEPQDSRSWTHLFSKKASRLPNITADETALLFYTSGTTGPAKGVPLTHGNLVFQLNAVLQAELISREDRLLVPLPFHHVYPFSIGMLLPLVGGMSIVIPRSITGPQIVRAIRETEATVVIGVPRLYRMLCAGIESQATSGGWGVAFLFKALLAVSTWLRRHLRLRVGKLLLYQVHKALSPKLRVLACGGAPLDPSLAWRLEGMGWKVSVGYGLTETAPLLTINPPGGGRIGSVGHPIPGVRIRVEPHLPAPGRSTDVLFEEPGEVLARGRNVFGGYRNLPEKTSEAFTPDGWFRTGDLGYFDADGYLYVTGRASTLIVTESGENVQPEEVEEVYAANPVIAEIGVLQKNGSLAALVVPASDTQSAKSYDNEVVRRAIAEGSRRLPSYQRIRAYTTVRHPLPRTRLGKIRRHLLPGLYEQARQRDRQASARATGEVSINDLPREDRVLLENPAVQSVWDILAKRPRDHPLNLDSNVQLDLGIDSLEWLDLTLEIGQRARVELNDEAISRVETVRDLLREVEARATIGAVATGVSPLDEPDKMVDERQKRWLEPLSPLMSVAVRLLYCVNWVAMRGLFRLQVKGVENLPENAQFILTPNHTSHLDAFAIAAAISYSQLRRIYWGGWTGAAFRNRFTRCISRLAQIVPIDPERGAVSSLTFGAAVLRRRKNLVWFPEGRRSDDGELQPFKTGVGLLVKHFKVQVVPAYIRGAYEALPPGKLLPRMKKITVAFDPPLSAGQLERDGRGGEPHERIVQALHERSVQLARRE